MSNRKRYCGKAFDASNPQHLRQLARKATRILVWVPALQDYLQVPKSVFLKEFSPDIYPEGYQVDAEIDADNSLRIG